MPFQVHSLGLRCHCIVDVELVLLFFIDLIGFSIVVVYIIAHYCKRKLYFINDLYFKRKSETCMMFICLI